MIRLAGVIALALCVSGPALADSSLCIPLASPRQYVAEHNGKWRVLTNDQRMFLAGVYTLYPRTPPGLPYGDRAALAQLDGQEGGLVFFLDGDKACTPMPVPKELIDMLMRLGEVRHEGGAT